MQVEGLMIGPSSFLDEDYNTFEMNLLAAEYEAERRSLEAEQEAEWYESWAAHMDNMEARGTAFPDWLGDEIQF